MDNQIPDKQYIYKGLLGHSYFPMVDSYREGTPPVFITKGFTTVIANEMLNRYKPESRGINGYDQIEYWVNRFNKVPRLMQIPHPLPYARLCQRISESWDDLKHICKNPTSRLKPARHDDKSIFSPIYHELQDFDDLDFRVLSVKNENFGHLMSKLELAKGRPYRVSADISLFFSSIYTHAIPWALVGHSEAKKNRNDSRWYNQLDSSQRLLKRNETQGIPIGPATSNIMSELILFNVDMELWKRGYAFTHFGDDYECYCETEDKAEMFLIHLAQELRHYLLNLNVQKVIIEKLPFSYKTEWVNELNNRLPPRENRARQQEIFNTLDYAINLQKRHPDGNVLKYAARSLASRIDERNAEVFLKYLISIALYNPTVLPILCKIAKKHHQAIAGIKFEPILKDFLRFRCSDTICWGLYFMAICGESISDELADAVINTKDCMSIGMFIALNQHKDKVIDFLNNNKNIDPDSEYECDQYWILLHELAPACPKFNHYRGVSGLKFLRNKNVHFIKPINALT